MLAHIITARTFALGDFGLSSGTVPAVLLNECKYKKGTEIYGDEEPAEYLYQVKIGAVRSCFLTDDVRYARFT